MAKVYILVDGHGRILRCDGGYTECNVGEDWVLLDEGTGDRYNLCQSHYFPATLMTESGVWRYKLENGTPRECTAEEIAEQEAALPTPVMSDKERIAELEAALEMLLSGVTE